MFFVPSSDGVQIAVHELVSRSGQPPVMLSHATGFHAHCYTPIARALGDRHCVFAPDYRGHGESRIDPNWEVDWRRFGDDALAVARRAAPDGGLIGFGHSMGGAALLMAAHAEPELFERLVLFEPIAHPATGPTLTPDEMRNLPIVQGALRRRDTFESFEAAFENYRDKPPMSLMTPDVLRSYVDHGFEPVDGGPTVTLRCRPQIEAGIFIGGRDNGVWAILPDISTPCLVIAGRVEDRQPSSSTEAIAAELPNGTFLQLPHQTHFGPFSHPDEIAALIAPRAV
jgi:pimeloyl-ACP methyl ester carboxylesterase